jgi:alkylated DNA repair dioxygenase AlkB
MFTYSDEVYFIDYKLENADVTHYKNFLVNTNNYEKLAEQIIWKQDYITIKDNTVKLPRKTSWYGEKVYRYSGITNIPNEWNEVLLEIKNSIELQLDKKFNSVLCNHYLNGNSSIGWHSDDETELEKDGVIASMSFGETRTFKLRNKETQEIVDIDLYDGDLLVMGGATQTFWEHSIQKTTKEIGPRINLTFRKVK